MGKSALIRRLGVLLELLWGGGMWVSSGGIAPPTPISPTYLVGLIIMLLSALALIYIQFIEPRRERQLDEKTKSLILERKTTTLTITDKLWEITTLERELLSANKIVLSDTEQRTVATKMRDYFKFIFPQTHNLSEFTKKFVTLNLEQRGIKDTLVPNDPEIEFIGNLSYFLGNEFKGLFNPIKTKQYRLLENEIYNKSILLSINIQTEINKYRTLSIGINIFPTFMNMFPQALELLPETSKPEHPFFIDKVNAHLIAHLSKIRTNIEKELHYDKPKP